MWRQNLNMLITSLILSAIFQVAASTSAKSSTVTNVQAEPHIYRLVEVAGPQWDDLKEFSEGLAGVAKDGQWGFIDKNGKLIINLQHDWKYAFPFRDGLAQVDVGGAKYDFVDKTGRGLVRSQRNHTDEDAAWPRMPGSSQPRLSFSCGLIPVANKRGEWGFMNQAGQLTISPQWGRSLDFQEGLAMVSNYDPTHRISKKGFINTNGQIAIPLQWDYASSFCEGLAVVMTNGLCGFINKSGEVVITPQWTACQPFRNGFALVLKESKEHEFEYKFGLIDRAGKTSVEPQFTGFMLGSAVVVFLHEKKGIIDKTGHVAGGLWWDSIKYPRVERENKWGLVNTNGEIVVQPRWEDIGQLESGLVPVKQDGRWGLIDQAENLVVKPQWEEINLSSLTTNLIVAKQGGKWGLFDATGKIVAQPQWDEVTQFSEGLAAVRSEGKWGLIDRIGKVNSPPKWDWAEPPHDGLLRIREGKKWRLIQVELN